MICIAIYVLIVLVILKYALKSAYTTYDGGECLVGKVAVVTGGNRGIGFEVCKYLASRGCKVIIACRSRAEKERRELILLTHNENIFLKQVDLKSFDSVRKLSKELHQTETKIDILVNNAGIAVDSGLSMDGLHPVMQTNVFSPFLLTHLLADLLKKSDDGRIIYSSSVMAFISNLTLENLNPVSSVDNTMSMTHYFQIYGNTKLAQIIVSNGMAEKFKKYGVKSNAIHPGMINTDIWQGLEFQAAPTVYETIAKWIFYITVFFYSRNAKEGAQGLLALAISDKYRDTTGQFLWGFGMANIYPNPRKLSDKAFCEKIYKQIEALVKLSPDECL